MIYDLVLITQIQQFVLILNNLNRFSDKVVPA